MSTTVIDIVTYHHMPDYADHPDVTDLTIRQALRVLRGVSWGDLGGMRAQLSDGGELVVELEPASGGGRLMGTQRAVRYGADGQQVRTYGVKSA